MRKEGGGGLEKREGGSTGILRVGAAFSLFVTKTQQNLCLLFLRSNNNNDNNKLYFPPLLE